MSTKGMHLFIPPNFDPTVPLLGPIQLAGFASSVNYEFYLQDFNNRLVRYIIDNAVMIARQNASLPNSVNLNELEVEACKKFIRLRKDITGYSELINELSICKTPGEYWQLIDYVRACYDLYSYNEHNLRFRLDGLDTKYRWNIWKDIEGFITEYQNSNLALLIREWLTTYDFKGCNLVGINITFESQLFIAALFCKIIREIKPEAFIVIGGGFVNSFIESEDSMGPIGRYCDVVFAGEGEALIQYLSEQEYPDYNQLRILGKSINGYACFIKAADICCKRLTVSPPMIQNGEIDEYLSPGRVLPLRFTYKCYWGKCKFCSDDESHSCLDPRYDYEKMTDYCIRQREKKLFDCIYFLDSAIPAKILNFFAEQLVKHNMRFNWGTNARLDREFCDEQFIKKLSESGCNFIKFGLESGSQSVLDLMDKGTDLNTAAKIINLCRKYNILVHTYIMFAYPGEREEDRNLTREFLLNDYSHPDNYNCSEFILYGTAPVAQELSYNFDIISSNEGWHSASYSFTSNEIKSDISKMREDFDKKFSPANILISTGHTISLSGQLAERNHNKIVLYDNTIVSLSDVVVYINEKECILAKWRRRDGIIYIRGEIALRIKSYFNNVPVKDVLDLGFTLDTIFNLINEGFVRIIKNGAGTPLEYNNSSQVDFFYGNKFNKFKWYGYYDAN